jgi:Fe-S-cluster containining protein
MVRPGKGHVLMSKTLKTSKPEDTFYFSCHPNIDCFTHCCQDINILLTPYDILQMKTRLGISSTEFLQKYTKTLIAPATSLPAVQFKMNEKDDKRCYFVNPTGCGIYEERPWSCRMYPMDNSGEGEGFVPMVDPSRCLGLKESKIWQLQDWFADQGLGPYNDWNLRFAQLTDDENVTAWRRHYPDNAGIFYLACYDLDRFRQTVFKQSLYDMIDPAHPEPERLRTDDLLLLEFAFTWLKAIAEREVGK